MLLNKLTIEYKKIKNIAISADLYINDHKSPVILYIHGGALIWGSKKNIVPQQIELFLNAGYSIMSIDYRLAPETKLEKIIEDVRDAIKWLKINGDKYKLDPSKIAVYGNSSGGYLGLVSGTFQEKPNAIISFYGYGDISDDWYSEPSDFYLKMPIVSKDQAHNLIEATPITEGNKNRFLYYLYCRQKGIWPSEVSGYGLLADKESLLQFCPLYNIDEGYPPTLLVHGNKDTDVPYEQSLEMHNALTKANVYNELITVDNAGHLFDYDMKNPKVKEIFQSVLTFLDRFFKDSNPETESEANIEEDISN